jgi:hypothetical protein
MRVILSESNHHYDVTIPLELEGCMVHFKHRLPNKYPPPYETSSQELFSDDKTSRYEYLVTYVDDILIWIKDPMRVIKSLEKIFLLKSVGIPEYYLGVNL